MFAKRIIDKSMTTLMNRKITLLKTLFIIFSIGNILHPDDKNCVSKDEKNCDEKKWVSAF